MNPQITKEGRVLLEQHLETQRRRLSEFSLSVFEAQDASRDPADPQLAEMKSELTRQEQVVADLSNLLDSAETVTAPPDEAGLGSRVRLKTGGKEMTVLLVTPAEASHAPRSRDSEDKWVSVDSPFGKAAVGLKTQQSFTVSRPGNADLKYTVVGLA